MSSEIASGSPTSSSPRNDGIDTLLHETRSFPPPEEFKKNANARDKSIYETALKDPELFWEQYANELSWIKRWTHVLEWEAPQAKWFVNGKLNVAANCVDRWAKGKLANKKAIVWEGEPGEERTLTYAELHVEVSKFGNVLKKLGVKKGDRIMIYMPLVPEAAIAMLACARVGAVHSVVFGGFSAESLRDRIQDAQAKVLITADGGYRRGGVVSLKAAADEALKDGTSIEHVVVLKRTDSMISWHDGRDHWWDDLMSEVSGVCTPERMDSEDMLYILYTSGTTGKPKGIVHTTGGYLTGVYATTKLVFDLKPNDVYWCTADIGWVTGHSYVVYGPLANGATVFMYEGAPDFPDKGRFWKLIEKYKVTIFYTAPTAIRAFMKWGVEWPQKSNLTSLRLLGSVGEPINPEAWMWYHQVIGGGKCPVVDTWWQTETGMILITPLPGLTTLKPGSATHPFPSIDARIVNEEGQEVRGGYLAIMKPWPAMLRGIYGDQERFVKQYWSKWPDVYFPGDGAKLDEEGYFWLLGRVDDVLNVAGHRIGTMEVESALVDHQSVAEAAVVGKPHEIKGEALVAFVTVKEGVTASPELIKELKEHVTKKIGAIARPEDIIFSADLPKTRSGKIMRRLLKDIAAGRVLGDTTTLADPEVVRKLKQAYESTEA